VSYTDEDKKDQTSCENKNKAGIANASILTESNKPLSIDEFLDLRKQVVCSHSSLGNREE
jgi:hypothetical protein